MKNDDIEFMDEQAGNEQFTPSTAFITWLACVFGLCGIHRFYLKKPFTGLLYLFTFGLFGIGQLIDLFRLRELVELENHRVRRLPARPRRLRLPPARKADLEEKMRRELLSAANQNGGYLSVSQGVLATGRPFAEVEKALDKMAVSGFVDIDNDPNSGAVVYTFGELAF